MRAIVTNSIYRVVVIAALLVFVSSVFAISTAEYRDQLSDSIVDVDDALAVIAEMELQEATPADLTAAIEYLREGLEIPIKVQDGANQIEVNVGRFNADFERFDKEANLGEKAIILTGIKEQLAATIQRIDDLESAKADNRSKDEEKRKLNEILNREEFQKPKEKEESLIQRWIREFFEWLDKQVPQPREQPSERTGFPAFSVVLQVLIYGAVAALVIFLLYKFAPFVFERLGINAEKNKGERVIFGERIADDVSANDIFAEAEELAQRGEMRLAIRKGYIATLCELSDRKIIGLARHKTNRDYLRDVRRKKGLFENLGGLTNRFERHWYGFQHFGASDWDEFRDLYRQTLTDTNN